MCISLSVNGFASKMIMTGEKWTAFEASARFRFWNGNCRPLSSYPAAFHFDIFFKSFLPLIRLIFTVF